MSDPFQAKLVFVGGSPRSGTTLVQRLLGAHSQVYAGPEFDYMPALAALRDKMVTSVENGCISAIADKNIVDDLFRVFVQTIFSAKAFSAGKSVFSEKTPSNLLHFRTLLDLFPDARFMMVVRHPYDIVASMKEVARKHRQMGKRPPAFCSDVQMSAREVDRYWHAGFEAALACPGRVHIVNYEDVVEAPGKAALDMCRFLELPEEPDMIRIDQADFEATQTGVSGWYTQEQLQTPIRQQGADGVGQRLSPAERAVVANTITVSHPAIKLI
ncbi:sulfotransferase family protein [Rhodophyticola sp.]|uniref:sulfotransferase family protein n=1 Tax=Rhodophyticola sp. TaxID=2680032 RepID=UPI003D285E62